MTEDTLSMIIGGEIAKQIWDSLVEQLLPNTVEREALLKESLANLKKGSLSIEEYVWKFKSICDNLAAINKPVPETEKVFQLTCGLGTKYQDFHIEMLTKPPYPSLSQFVLSLQNHEQILNAQQDKEKQIDDHSQVFYG